MRARLVAVVVGIGAMWSGAVEAQQRYQTIWAFSVVYPTGQTWSSSDASISEPLMMPVGSPWRCQRMAAALGQNGLIMSGFVCNDGHAATNVFAHCNGSGIDADRAHASVADLQASGMVALTVRCETRAVGGPPQRSAEKNL